jgi:hypothetical protein
MIPNEFINNQFAAVFFSHNFGRFLKPSKKFNPEIEVYMQWQLVLVTIPIGF